MVEFDGLVIKTVDEMIEEGTLFVRSLESMREGINARFNQQIAKADAYNLDFFAYEGGQHFAAAIWGAFRGNLGNTELIDFLAHLNETPEIVDL